LYQIVTKNITTGDFRPGSGPGFHPKRVKIGETREKIVN